MLKGKGVKSNPRQIATSILANVPQNDLVQKVGQHSVLITLVANSIVWGEGKYFDPVMFCKEVEK